MLYEVITSQPIGYKKIYTKGWGQQADSQVHNHNYAEMDWINMIFRITSYNVCYTKLLRMGSGPKLLQ